MELGDTSPSKVRNKKLLTREEAVLVKEAGMTTVSNSRKALNRNRRRSQKLCIEKSHVGSDGWFVDTRADDGWTVYIIAV